MAGRKRPPVQIVLLLLIAIAGFARVAQGPSFAQYRAVDVVQLVGCGICLGVALTAVIFTLRDRRA